MFIETKIHLHLVNTTLAAINVEQKSSVSHVSPMLLNTATIVTLRPYLDEDGIPDFEYAHVSVVNGESMLIEYNYNLLKELLL